MPPRGRPRDRAAEEAILRAALELFAEGGSAATTFDGVARRAEVSRSTLYRRFRTRDDLLVAALQWLRADGESGLEDWAQRPFAEVMQIFTTMTARALVDPHSMDLLRQVVALPADSRVRTTYWASVVAPRRSTFSALVRAARDRGELPPGPDPELLQDQLSGALLHRALVDPEPLDESAAIAYTHDLVASLGLSPARGGRGERNPGPAPSSRPEQAGT